MTKKLELFIGPCVLESEELAFQIAETVKNELSEFSSKVNFTFKGSFDKANRTSINSYRGPGIEKGLAILNNVKEKYSLKTLTDFHFPEQAEKVAESVDILQVPAFLCRQTDMIISGAEACKKYNRILKMYYNYISNL